MSWSREEAALKCVQALQYAPSGTHRRCRRPGTRPTTRSPSARAGSRSGSASSPSTRTSPSRTNCPTAPSAELSATAATRTGLASQRPGPLCGRGERPRGRGTTTTRTPRRPASRAQWRSHGAEARHREHRGLRQPAGARGARTRIAAAVTMSEQLGGGGSVSSAFRETRVFVAGGRGRRCASRTWSTGKAAS
jgi:hypothetical protein